MRRNKTIKQGKNKTTRLGRGGDNRCCRLRCGGGLRGLGRGLERSNRGGLLNLGWVLVDLGGDGNFFLGLRFEQVGDAGRNATSKLLGLGIKVSRWNESRCGRRVP